MKSYLAASIITLFIFQFFSCHSSNSDKNAATSPAPAVTSEVEKPEVVLGADKIDEIMEIIDGRRVALIINQTSVLSDEKNTFLLDTLLSRGADIKKVFAPEHGFRGDADAGETVKDGKDIKTGHPLISLYGKNKKPSKEQLADVDLVIFDIQDVGARFYTYISTMLYGMESSAENDKDFLVLDRPNPNDYIEGPVLEENCKSFVGTMPIPVLHGLTVAELAKMIQGENWINGNLNLKFITMDNWKHGEPYSLPVKPSPNLPNDDAVRLYPSLCLFEGTEVSIGRGTYFPFQVIGFPDPAFGDFTFTPKSLPGFDKNPLQKDKLCYGIDLRQDSTTNGFSLKYFIDFYNKSKEKQKFISRKRFFDLLAGTESLRKQIEAGKTEEEIIATWQEGLNGYKDMRMQYLIYPDYDL